MKDVDFAHLHLHTDASLRDGLGTVPRMMRAAKGLGFTKIAMTDHGTLANAITFSIEAKALGIKPLMGLEGYVAFDGQIGHITLLADGMAGWNSLLRLNNLAHAGTYRQPAFDIDQLLMNTDGLVCLTGCIASPLQQLSFKEAQRLAYTLKDYFGHRLFAECMFVGDSLGWERPLRLASSVGLKPVITNDVHFPYQGDAGIHPILTQMKSGFKYDSSQLFMKSASQLAGNAKRHGLDESEVYDMLQRAGNIARLLKPVDLRGEPTLPMMGGDKYKVYKLAEESPRFYHTESDTEYANRFHYELDIIDSMGYLDYFIILHDLIRVAREKGVRVGPGRGSGCGSLILYLLEITDVDPIKYGLQFERFLNPEREGMPDVNVDLDSENRDKVLRYAAAEYGAVPIATYSHYSHKSLTRDLGKMFRIDRDVVAKVADGGVSVGEFAAIIDEHPQFIQAYEAFMGQIRHKGKHAGGIIITDTPVPIERIGDSLGAAWSEGKKNELSYAGIVKFDLLGLTVLSALRRLEEEFKTSPDEPYPDAPEFELFRSGDLSGIFQFAGSEGIRQLTMELQPTKFEELIAINALWRPGAIDAGSTAKYPTWKVTPRKVHPYIADILEETYGAIVYQEQVMEIFRRTVDGTLGDADSARRVITKSKPDDEAWVLKMEYTRARFIGGAHTNHGIGYSEALALWEELATHSNYSFNKAHSTAYAMISWECAWWKFHYPAHFYAAMLNVDSANEQTYIIDAVKYGIIIKPPHVNKSNDEWKAIDKTRISMPLSAIKFMGQRGVEVLMQTREILGGEFKSVDDFMKSVPKTSRAD